MVKVVFLDIDNTLLSFSECVRQSMREGFSQFGLKPYTEDMFPVFERINNSLWRQIEQGTMSVEELKEVRWSKILGELGIDFDGRAFEKYFRERLFTSAIPEEGANELLEYLSPKYTLCVASNGPYEQQRNRLKAGGMDRFFTHYFVSAQIGASKPSRQFFDSCFKTLRENGFPNLQPKEAMIVGDSLTSDMLGGHDYGLQTCWYRKDVSKESDLADFTVKTLSEIKEIL